MKTILVAIIAMVLVSCHDREQDKDETVTANMEIAEMMDTTVAAAEIPEQRDDRQKIPVQNSPAPVAADWTRKIIRTAEVKIGLEHYESFNTAVHQALRNYGAYIASEEQVQTDAEISNILSIKVPVDRFEPLLNYLTAPGKNKILQKQVSSADVTSEYVDTRSRLETRKQVRAKYYELLKQAKKMDDVLQVQSEINGITEEIEAAAGRIQFLGQQTTYSTINLRYFQVLHAGATDNANPGFFSRLVRAVREGAGTVGDLVVLVAYLWPLALLAVIAWLLVRRTNFFKPKTGA